MHTQRPPRTVHERMVACFRRIENQARLQLKNESKVLRFIKRHQAKAKNGEIGISFEQFKAGTSMDKQLIQRTLRRLELKGRILVKSRAFRAHAFRVIDNDLPF